MNCSLCRGQLSPYLEEELSAEQRGAVEQHLSACAACTTELKALQEMVKGLKELPESMVPLEFRQKVWQRIEAVSPWVRFRQRLLEPWYFKVPAGAVATVAVVLLAVQVSHHTAPMLNKQMVSQEELPPALQQGPEWDELKKRLMPEKSQFPAPLVEKDGSTRLKTAPPAPEAAGRSELAQRLQVEEAVKNDVADSVKEEKAAYVQPLPESQKLPVALGASAPAPGKRERNESENADRSVGHDALTVNASRTDTNDAYLVVEGQARVTPIPNASLPPSMESARVEYAKRREVVSSGAGLEERSLPKAPAVQVGPLLPGQLPEPIRPPLPAARTRVRLKVRDINSAHQAILHLIAEIPMQEVQTPFPIIHHELLMEPERVDLFLDGLQALGKLEHVEEQGSEGEASGQRLIVLDLVPSSTP